MKKKLNCLECKNNPMGICELVGKEVPASYVMGRNRGVPKFCPLVGEKK